MNVSVKIDGIEAFRQLLLEMPTKAEKGAHAALKICSLDLMGKAQDLAPILTGDLRGSAYAVVGGEGEINTQRNDANPDTARLPVPQVTGKLNAIVGFTEPYSTKVHESLAMNHPLGGQAKFLEAPFAANRDKYLKLIGEAIAKEVEKK